jgi:hypothetical protein
MGQTRFAALSVAAKLAAELAYIFLEVQRADSTLQQVFSPIYTP